MNNFCLILTGSISSNFLYSMVKEILGRPETSGGRSLLWNDGLLRKGLPK